WSYPFDINWPTDRSHPMQLQVRGEDKALSSAGTGNGNIGTPSLVGTDIINFNVDFVLPGATITWPTANASVSSATVRMTGPASDDLSNLKVAGGVKVEISTGLGGSKYYWTGSSYTVIQT